MELTAACVALETIDEGHLVTVYSDSSYLINCMRKGWYKRWRQNGWLTHLKGRVKKHKAPRAWGRGRDFELADGEYRIREELLRHLYDAIVAFNVPILNDPILRQVFDLRAVATALQRGELDDFLALWAEAGPDQTARIVAEEV